LNWNIVNNFFLSVLRNIFNSSFISRLWNIFSLVFNGIIVGISFLDWNIFYSGDSFIISISSFIRNLFNSSLSFNGLSHLVNG